MSDIFASHNGRLVAIPDQEPDFAVVSVDWNNSTTNLSSTTATSTGMIVADLAFALEVSSQIQTAFDNSVYTTAFGDKPGTLQITYVLNRGCTGEHTSGLDQFLSQYQTYRLKPGNEDIPLQIQVGSGTTFRAFLLKAQAKVSGNEPTMMGQATFVAWKV